LALSLSLASSTTRHARSALSRRRASDAELDSDTVLLLSTVAIPRNVKSPPLPFAGSSSSDWTDPTPTTPPPPPDLPTTPGGRSNSPPGAVPNTGDCRPTNKFKLRPPQVPPVPPPPLPTHPSLPRTKPATAPRLVGRAGGTTPAGDGDRKDRTDPSGSVGLVSARLSNRGKTRGSSSSSASSLQQPLPPSSPFSLSTTTTPLPLPLPSFRPLREGGDKCCALSSAGTRRKSLVPSCVLDLTRGGERWVPPPPSGRPAPILAASPLANGSVVALSRSVSRSLYGFVFLVWWSPHGAPLLLP
ncbi:unnamed protein product, partial [Ectocarpus sp. 8 AP-2014]